MSTTWLVVVVANVGLLEQELGGAIDRGKGPALQGVQLIRCGVCTDYVSDATPPRRDGYPMRRCTLSKSLYPPTRSKSHPPLGLSMSYAAQHDISAAMPVNI